MISKQFRECITELFNSASDSGSGFPSRMIRGKKLDMYGRW